MTEGESIFQQNARLRLAQLGTTWEDLAKQGGEEPGNVRGWVRRANPRRDTLTRLAKLLGVPEHELINPEFDPRAFPAPSFAQPDGDEGNETSRDEFNDRDRQALS